MQKSNNKKEVRKMMTAMEVQREFLNMDIRKIRTFLNQYCNYKKIGNTYMYLRSEVEALLLDQDNSYEFPLERY